MSNIDKNQRGQTFGGREKWQQRLNCTSHTLSCLQGISFTCCL